MKKILTTMVCASVIFIGAQCALSAESNTTYTKANPNSFSTERKAPPNFEQGKMHKPPMPNLEEELNLSEAQKQQARQNRIQGRKQLKPVMEEIMAKKEAVLDVMDSELSDEKKKEKLQALQTEIKALHKKANELREKNMQEFEKILTTEQRAKFEQLKAKNAPPRDCQKCRMMPPPPMNEE